MNTVAILLLALMGCALIQAASLKARMSNVKKYTFLTICGISCLIYPLSLVINYDKTFSFSAVFSVGNGSQLQNTTILKNMSTPTPVRFNETNPPKMLLWTDFWGSRFFTTPRNCSLKCERTMDKSQWHLSDAIVFYTPNAGGPLPPGRIQNQKWIFYMHESPYLGSVHDKRLSGIFNWTITYQQDSDVFHPYGRYLRREKSVPMQPQPTQRSKIAVWLVSHCDTYSQREVLFDKLSKLVTTTKYGSCSGNKCGKDRVECLKDFQQDYYFYLAWENSLCDDYITEKLWNALAAGIVPVVYGGADYQKLLPPNSFIDILHFKNIQELADYLIYLTKNVTAFQEYHRWTEDYTISLECYERLFCDLCEALYIEREKPTITTVTNIIDFFSVQRRCSRRVKEKDQFFNNSP